MWLCERVEEIKALAAHGVMVRTPLSSTQAGRPSLGFNPKLNPKPLSSPQAGRRSLGFNPKLNPKT